ncbi:MAG: ABC transporter ATP-binding protein [Betaproteobacteria bacterium]|nr:ABC transporter ATP-binding protein [Betaproteobacteria bacterium]
MDRPTEGLRARLRQQRPIPLAAELACAGGELLALVGPSGSGKSTILRTLAGIYRPHEGTIAVGGETWLDSARGIEVAPRERSVGFVFQHYALFPHLTAQENVMQAMGHVPGGERRERALRLLERTNLAGLEDRRPARLSGGQQQRVAVARALARDPKVLLLDEPFSAVDQITREKLHEELATLRRELNIPIVLVTHALDEAVALADRMSILHRGTTLQAGEPAQLIARPASPLVARLIGLKNIFDAEVVGHDAVRRLTVIRWAGQPLEAAHAPQFAVGSRVGWSIPPARILLHRRDRPSRGDHENPVSGTVVRCLRLGDMTSIALSVVAGERSDIFFNVPTHVAQRNGIAPGAAASVSLLAEGIHLMPTAAAPTPGVEP